MSQDEFTSQYARLYLTVAAMLEVMLETQNKGFYARHQGKHLFAHIERKLKELSHPLEIDHKDGERSIALANWREDFTEKYCEFLTKYVNETTEIV